MNKIDVSVSFDFEHDRALYAELLEQSRAPGSTFSVSGCSERFTTEDVWSERVRRRVHRADQTIVICGVHTDEAMGVFTELRIVREEQQPYFLLWGRRDRMCTKPVGAKPSEGMYSWTSEIVQDQIALMARKVHRDAAVRGMKRGAKPYLSGGTVSIP